MSKVKAGGTATSLTDSNPKFLGVKLNHGQLVKPGGIIVRQRGTVFMPGKNVKIGNDHTIYAVTEGIVHFGTKRKKHFDNSTVVRNTVNVVPQK